MKPVTLYMPDGQIIENPEKLEGTIYSGSFNPLHEAHKSIAEKFDNTIFEISQTRYEKEPYSDEKITELVKQFSWKWPVLVTNCTFFLDKVRLMSTLGSTDFVMGYDTFERFLNMTEGIPIPFKVIAVGRKLNGVNKDPRDLWHNQIENLEVEFVDLYMEISSSKIRTQL